MRDWSLNCASNTSTPGDPLVLTLAADMRLCKPDYFNDHIWELEIGSGDPSSIAVRTTYGLRARNMRLFFRFGEAGQVVTSPSSFVQAPRLRRFYPNFLSLNFVPLEGLEVSAEYWVPESHVLAGRVTLTNRTASARKVDFDLCAALTPLDGKALAFGQQQLVNVLSGRTGGLSPVLFMTGGPSQGPGPHPSLILQPDLASGASHAIFWCMCAEGSPEASFELARRTAARTWEAERTRIELLDSGDTLEIHTGDPDWDAALAFSQKMALGSLYGGGEHLPHPSFVNSRQPDSGYSHSGTGMDHPSGWNGQTPLEAYYAASLLPGVTGLRRGLIENFLSVQAEDGAIDGKPGIAGQRSRVLAAPFLASMAWDEYEDSQDQAFLEQSFPKLFRYFERWFAPDHDRDGDGVPEWDHVLQTGFEDHPLFDTWHPWSQGLPIAAAFNPELEALLYRESTALIRMAEKLERTAEIGKLHERAAALRSSVEAGWNGERNLYCYRDRLTELCSSGQLIAKHKGSGEMRPRKARFAQPVRLLVEIQTEEPGARRPVVEISGFGADSPAGAEQPRQRERLEEEQFHWRAGGLTAITTKSYCKVGFVSVTGLEEADKLSVRSLDTTEQDITLFTPLWAHIPEVARAEAIVRTALADGGAFHKEFGIRSLANLPDPRAEDLAMSVRLPWNQLIGEGLLAYGYRKEAGRLIEQLMQAAIRCLKQSQSFYEYYHAETGKGIGERGALTGLAPVGLFLRVLGVHIISPGSVHLEGRNPFSWPVTILHKGLKIERGLEATTLVFPNGQTVQVTATEPCLITL